jgi:hypothetical protein
MWLIIISLSPASGAFSLGLLFHPEDGGDIVIRNAGPLGRAQYYQYAFQPKLSTYFYF